MSEYMSEPMSAPLLVQALVPKRDSLSVRVSVPMLVRALALVSAQMCRHRLVSTWGMQSEIESVPWLALWSGSLSSVRTSQCRPANTSDMLLGRLLDPPWATLLVLRSAA